MSRQFQNMIDQAAYSVTQAHPDTWAELVEYFLQRIGEHAESDAAYLAMLASVGNGIRDYIVTREW